MKTLPRNKSDIAAAMRKRYPANAYAVLYEVGDATGMNCSRHADAIAMSLWPSRGLDLIGFEFKSSRNDWLKERDNPAKAEAVMQYCDYWYLVVGNAAIVHDGELPKQWGLLAVQNNTLREIHPAPQLSPKPWTRDFLAAILRRVSEPIAALDSTAILRAKEEGRKEEAARNEATFKAISDKYAALQTAVEQFESHAGVKITHRWSGLSACELANALSTLADGSFTKQISTLRQMLRDVESFRAELDATITGIAKLTEVAE